MAFMHKTTYEFTRGGVGRVTGSIETTGNGETNRNVAAPAATVTEVDVDFAFADLKRVLVISDKDFSLKTNSSGSPADTIAIKAGKPFVWEADTGYFDNPFTVDVTSIFIDNGAGAVANVQMYFLVNA